MINIDIHVTTYEGKKGELYNTMLGYKSSLGLLAQLKNQIGCNSYQFKEVNPHTNEFRINSKWKNWVVLEEHLRSDVFSVLLGMLQTICRIHQVRITDGSCEYGMELLERLRG